MSGSPLLTRWTSRDHASVDALAPIVARDSHIVAAMKASPPSTDSTPPTMTPSSSRGAAPSVRRLEPLVPLLR